MCTFVSDAMYMCVGPFRGQKKASDLYISWHGAGKLLGSSSREASTLTCCRKQPITFKVTTHKGMTSYTIYGDVKHVSGLFSSCGIQFLFSFPTEDSDLWVYS